MANQFSPFGFRPVRRVDAADPTFALDARQVLNTYNTAIGHGDACKMVASGYIQRATSGDNALADPGIYGVFWGCEYYDTTLQKPVWSKHWPVPGTNVLAGSVVANIISDPRVIFEVQVGASGSGPISLATTGQIGMNIGIFDGTVSAIGMSAQAVDFSTLAATITLPFRVYDVSPLVGNDNTSANNVIWVTLNNSTFNSRTGI